MREKKSGALKVIKDRVDACLEAGKDDATIKACRDDDDVKKIRAKIRPTRKEKADNREQRAKAAVDALADCKRAGSTGCENKAKEKAKKLLPKKEAKVDEETEEPWESMKGKRKKERMRRAVQNCDKGKEATCAKAAKDDLKKDLDVDEKEIAMIKRQTAPMMAADEIAECEDAINGDKTEIDTVNKDCEALGKDLFMATGSTAEAWEKRWKARVLKLAKARFAGEDSDVKVNTKQVDTVFEADAVAGKCDDDMVEQARNDVGNAAKKGDKDGKGETVVKFKGVDSATKKCSVVFATKVSEGKHKEAAASINKATEVGKKKKTGRMLRNLEDDAEGSVSSSPTAEEVPAGSSAESTDFSKGGLTTNDGGDATKGGLDIVTIACVSAAALVVVGSIVGVAAMRKGWCRSNNDTMNNSAGVGIELSDDPFEGRGRTNSVNPMHPELGVEAASMGKNPMLK